MAASLEMRSLRLYGNSALNYLNDWVRRTDNVDNYDQFEVQVQLDPDTGEQWGNIVRKDAHEDAPVEEKPVARRRSK